MARVPAKKSLKSTKKKVAIKPVDISVPSYDSEVEDGDLLLINRSGVDYNTDAGDLAQYVGGELGLDALVGEINTEIDGINVSITENAGDLTDLEARVKANEDGVAQNATDITTNAGGISQNATDITTNASGIAANVTAIAGNATDIANNASDISTNAAAIATNTTAIAASDAENVRQNSWTGVSAGSNADTGATHQARITKAELDIIALQGALIYKGVGDFTGPAPSAITGHFYLCAADGTASGWTGLTAVKENSYYAYNGSIWQESGSTSVVIPTPNDGALTLTSGNDAIEVVTGSGFSADAAGNVEYQVKLDLNDEGGLGITSDGLGIAPKPNSGIIVDADGISVDPDFIESNSLSDVPTLQAVTEKGATTTVGITALGVTATGTQAQSSFLLKNIAQLPSLADA
jgi:hypothetical protein